MKIIISHDVDHITVLEHTRDFIIPKFIVRSLIELGFGYTSISEINKRFAECLKNKWQSIEELMKFDKENNVPSTFFVGVSKGKGLCYSLENAEYWIKKIMERGFDIGVHGIAYDNYELIKAESDTFKRISNLKKFGIRMHYLRHNEYTLDYLDKAEYLFDTSIYELKNPYKIGNLWEFPLHIMDGYIFYNKSRWQNVLLEKARQDTRSLIEKAHENGINYFTILFHDRYFSEGFKQWKEWYMCLINYLKNNGFSFINYKNAITELESYEKV